MKYINTNMNEVLMALDASLKRERTLRNAVDELFLLLCKHCTEEELRQICCLDRLKELA